MPIVGQQAAQTDHQGRVFQVALDQRQIAIGVQRRDVVGRVARPIERCCLATALAVAAEGVELGRIIERIFGVELEFAFIGGRLALTEHALAIGGGTHAARTEIVTGAVGVVVVGTLARDVDKAVVTQGKPGIAADVALDAVALLVLAELGRD